MADSAAETTPDENRGPEILAVCGSLVGLATLVVALRIWVRARMVKHIGADDWTIIAAMVCLRPRVFRIFMDILSVVVPAPGTSSLYALGNHVCRR